MARSFSKRKEKWEIDKAETTKATAENFIRSELSDQEADVNELKDTIYRGSKDRNLEALSGEPALPVVAHWSPRRYKNEVNKYNVEGFISVLWAEKENCAPILDFVREARRLNDLIQETVDRCVAGVMDGDQQCSSPPVGEGRDIERLREIEPSELSNFQLCAALEDERKRLFEAPTPKDAQVNSAHTADLGMTEGDMSSYGFPDIDLTEFMDGMDNMDGWLMESGM